MRKISHHRVHLAIKQLSRAMKHYQGFVTYVLSLIMFVNVRSVNSASYVNYKGLLRPG